MTYVNVEKAFNRVPRKVLWWAVYAVGVREWLVKVVQACVWVTEVERV